MCGAGSNFAPNNLRQPSGMESDFSSRSRLPVSSALISPAPSVVKVMLVVGRSSFTSRRGSCTGAAAITATPPSSSTPASTAAITLGGGATRASSGTPPSISTRPASIFAAMAAASASAWGFQTSWVQTSVSPNESAMARRSRFC